MIVQEADRFGLAQLHQLRGRVGRGAEQSYCLLVSRPKEELTETAVARLEALVDTPDGFELAEVDLELRGAGELLGTRQSGLTDFRFARLVADRPLLELARVEADALVDYDGPLDDEIERVFGEATRNRLRSCESSPASSRKGARIFAPKGSRDAADLGPRSGGGVRDSRPDRGRARARPLRGLGRARARGPVARRRERGVRRVGPRRRQGDRAESRKLGLTGADMVRADALRYLATTRRAYELVFLDPPYEIG